jgi:hypothetical protein
LNTVDDWLSSVQRLSRTHRPFRRIAQAFSDAQQSSKLRIFIFSAQRIFLTNQLFKCPETGAAKDSRMIKKP